MRNRIVGFINTNLIFSSFKIKERTKTNKKVLNLKLFLIKQRIEEFRKSANNILNDQLKDVHEKLTDRKIFRLGDIDRISRIHTTMNDNMQKKIRRAISNGKLKKKLVARCHSINT